MVRIDRRRYLAGVCRLLCAFVAVAVAPAVVAESAVRSVDVRSSGEGYVADLVMWMPVPQELAFDVLVDFEHVANWTPNIRESRVVRREPNRATVEYSGVAHLGVVAVPFTTVREVEIAPPAVIESTQVKGTMRRHKSRITLAADAGGTRLDYHLEMEPSAIAAALLNRSRIEQELRDTFDAAAGEMLRRQAARSPGAR